MSVGHGCARAQAISPDDVRGGVRFFMNTKTEPKMEKCSRIVEATVGFSGQTGHRSNRHAS
jgi:hypothetical protein